MASKAAKPLKQNLPAPDVKAFRLALDTALKAKAHPTDKKPISSTTWGVYCFYDFEGEPIYVGQTKESLRTRIRRHLTNQRTDAVGMRVLDPYEIQDLELWPIFDLEGTKAGDPDAKLYLDRLERTVYERALAASKFGVILNEKIPPDVLKLPDNELPKSYRFPLVSDELLDVRLHADNRIARRGETLGRLTNVVRERGEVSNGLRRVVVVQAARLAWLGAQRLAEAEGRTEPPLSKTIRLSDLVGGASKPDEDLDADAD